MLKKLRAVHESVRAHWVGDGFHVHSVFDYNGLGRELSPFLLLDYGAPTEFPPGREPRGVGAHPHRGFETVTLAYQGEVQHRDSSGGGGRIGPGDVQWMTAAAGLVHEEFHSPEFTRSGGTLQMAQLWVNLPARHKTAPPRYQTLLKGDIPKVPLPDEAGLVRVIAGAYGDHAGPAKTFTPVNLWDVHLKAGATVELPVPDGHTTALLVVRGTVRINGASEAAEADLAVFAREGQALALKAVSDALLLVMDGEPIDEPIFGRGPFVMNSQAEIDQAFEDCSAGRMGVIDP